MTGVRFLAERVVWEPKLMPKPVLKDEEQAPVEPGMMGVGKDQHGFDITSRIKSSHLGPTDLMSN